jgi:hypothetical protein
MQASPVIIRYGLELGLKLGLILGLELGLDPLHFIHNLGQVTTVSIEEYISLPPGDPNPNPNPHLTPTESWMLWVCLSLVWYVSLAETLLVLLSAAPSFAETQPAKRNSLKQFELSCSLANSRMR